jgi:hypothetical protein
MGLALLILFDPVARGPDVATYLGYARSLFFDGDILLFNEFPILQRKLFVTPTGYATVLQNIGTTFFLLPWYAVAHGSVWLTTTLIGTELSTDGFNGLYWVWLNFGHWLYGLAALVLSYRWARRYASQRAALLAALFVCIASPFFYYVTAFIPNSSIPSALIGIIFVSAWDEARRQDTWPRWFLLGSLAGVLLCIANYNITFLCFPLVSFSATFIKNFRSDAKRRNFGSLITFGGGIIIGFMPQLLTWRILFGSPFANPYAGQLAWLQPRIVEVLFSSYHGLFFYAPFLAIALLGFIPLWRRDRTLALSLLLTFSAQAYISGTNLGWWAGGSFGQRYFLGLTPLFVLCAATLFDLRFQTAQQCFSIEDFGFRLNTWRSTLHAPLTHYFLLITSFICFAWTYLLFLGVFANRQSIVYAYPPAEQWTNQLANLADLPRLLSAHLLTIKSPLAPIMLLPFMLIVGLCALMTRQLLRVPALQSSRLVVACALLPLLPSALLIRAENIGAEHLRDTQTHEFYQTLPRAANDPDDTSYTYTERAVYYLRNSDERAAEDDFLRAQSVLPSNSWTTLRVTDLQYISQHVDWRTNEPIALSGYHINSFSQTVRATFYWSVLVTPVPTYTVQVAVLDEQNNPLGQLTQLPTQGQRPFAQWQVGELVRDTYAMPLTAITSQTFTLKLTVSLAANQVVTRTLRCNIQDQCTLP